MTTVGTPNDGALISPIQLQNYLKRTGWTRVAMPRRRRGVVRYDYTDPSYVGAALSVHVLTDTTFRDYDRRTSETLDVLEALANQQSHVGHRPSRKDIIDEMTLPPLAKLMKAVKQSLADGVEQGIDAIGLGLYTVDGRHTSVVVREISKGTFEVSDGGETWSDLWIEGRVGSKPPRALLKKLTAVCEAYEVTWDAQSNRIVGMGTYADIPSICTRISTASISIAAWRYWIPRRSRA